MLTLRAGVVIGVLSILLAAPDAPVRAQSHDLDERVRASSCRTAVRELLAAWHTAGEAFVTPADTAGQTVWRLPTDRLGVWVTVTTTPSAPPVLSRIAADLQLRIRFDRGCEPRRETIAGPRPSSALPVFDDSDLSALVASGDPGVILVWSPHMPLSVDAYPEMVRAAAALDLPLTVLLDPLADVDYARDVARTAAMPPMTLRSFHSVELAFRNATLHAPSVLVYAGGRMRGLAIPGYRDSAGYRSVVAPRLETADDAGAP